MPPSFLAPPRSTSTSWRKTSTSIKRREILDDERHVLSFKVVGGECQLNNYMFVTSVNEFRREEGIEGGWRGEDDILPHRPSLVNARARHSTMRMRGAGGGLGGGVGVGATVESCKHRPVIDVGATGEVKEVDNDHDFQSTVTCTPAPLTTASSSYSFCFHF